MATKRARSAADAIADIDRAIARLSTVARRAYDREALRDRAITVALRDVAATAKGAIGFARSANTSGGPFGDRYAALNGITWQRRVDRVIADAGVLGREISRAEKMVAIGKMTPARNAKFVSDRIRTLLRSPLKRIAETEAYAASKEALLNSFVADPAIGAVRWETTSAKPCKRCIALRDTDFFSLGAGVYPIGRVPRPPHPHCKCRLTPVHIDRATAAASKLRAVAPSLPSDTTRDEAKRVRDDLAQLFKESGALDTLEERKIIGKATAATPTSDTPSAPHRADLAPDVAYPGIRDLAARDWAREAIQSATAGTSGSRLPEIRVVRENARQAFVDAMKRLGGPRARLRLSTFDDPEPEMDGAHATYNFVNQVMRVGPDTTTDFDRWLAGARDGASWRAMQSVVHEMHHATSAYGEWAGANIRVLGKMGENMLEASRRLEESMVEHLARRATVEMASGDAKVALHLEAIGSYPVEIPIARIIERRLGGARLMQLYQTGSVADRIVSATNALTEIFTSIVDSAGLSVIDRADVVATWAKINDAAKIDAATKGKLLWALDGARTRDEVVARLVDFGWLDGG